MTVDIKLGCGVGGGGCDDAILVTEWGGGGGWGEEGIRQVQVFNRGNRTEILRHWSPNCAKTDGAETVKNSTR